MNQENSEFAEVLREYAARVDRALQEWLPESAPLVCGDLNEAVRYSALAGGKRIRPALCMMVAEGLGLNSQASLRAGCAYELIHAYSLIHDDLPAMDNDDFRRGKPTNHKVFGEATAILAGDSLLTMAFAWLGTLGEYDVSADKVVKIIQLAAQAAGSQGMIGGQMLDMKNEKQKIDLETLEGIHRRKTGALIVAPVETAAILADANKEDLSLLLEFAQKAGLLFQIIDDILDVEGDASALGKTTGRDNELGKATYPALMGLQQAKAYATNVRDKALADLGKLSRRLINLERMTDFIFYRLS